MVLLNCEESAEQLFAQFAALDTPEQRPQPRGARMDLRTYGIGAQILKDLGVVSIRNLATSSRSYIGLSGFGIELLGQEPIEG